MFYILGEKISGNYIVSLAGFYVLIEDALIMIL